MAEYVSFNHFMRWVRNQGTTLQHEIEGLLAEESPEPEYTIYWPKDSIRVIPGSSYAVARTVLAVLRDPRTRWMGAPTSTIPAELSLARREIVSGANYWASDGQVRNGSVYKRDRLLPGDISGDLDFYSFEQSDPSVTIRLDLSTIPEA